MILALGLGAGGLAGCGRGAPPGSATENLLPGQAGQPVAAARVAAAAIDIGSAEELFSAVDHDLDAADVSGLSRDFGQLSRLPASDLNTNIGWQRQVDLAQVSLALLRNWAQGRVNEAQAQMIQRAGEIATEVTEHINENFREALTEVTEDAIRGQVCQDMLNLVTGYLSPDQISQSDTDDWQGDLQDHAYQLLASTFTPSSIGQVMEWAGWGKEVNSSSTQAYQALLANPEPYVRILSTSPGRRATAVFVRYCYAPPAFGESP